MKQYFNILIFTLFILTPNLSYAEQIKEGFGKAQLPDSSVYEGNFKDGMFNGKGILVWRNGSRYEGEFKDGFFAGEGIFIGIDGSKYQGEFKDGLMDGKGVLTQRNGEKYVGNFVSGEFEGFGTYTYTNGGRYEGESKNNLFDGRGTLFYVNGDKYEGEFKNGLPSGKGILIRSNGERDEGEFKNGTLNGKVKITDAGGIIFEGECNNGFGYCKGAIIRKDGVKEGYEIRNSKFYPLKQKPKSADTDFVIPKEVDNIMQLSEKAFSKINFFKFSESICVNGKCIDQYIEINKLEKKAHMKVKQGTNTIEAYVIDGMTYQKGSGYDINVKTWRKTKTVMKRIADFLDLNSRQNTWAQCLNMCPYYKPKGMILEQVKRDGREYYVVNEIYPDKTTQNLSLKTTYKIFYDKNSYLPYGYEMNSEGLTSDSVQTKYYDYNIPLEIKLPPEAVNAVEVSLEEIKSLK